MADIEFLYSQYFGFICKFLLSHCRDIDLAEELTQETFFRAFMNIRQLRDDSKAVCWLCSIARNLLNSHYNRVSRLSPLDEAGEIASKQDIEYEVETKMLSDRAMTALKALEEPYREVFMLSFFASLPLNKISRLFGKSESWARVTLYRAKQKIIQEIQQ